MIKYTHFRSLKIKTYLNIALEERLPGGGYFGVKRIGMTVGNPRNLP